MLIDASFVTFSVLHTELRGCCLFVSVFFVISVRTKGQTSELGGHVPFAQRNFNLYISGELGMAAMATEAGVAAAGTAAVGFGLFNYNRRCPSCPWTWNT